MTSNPGVHLDAQDREGCRIDIQLVRADEMLGGR